MHTTWLGSMHRYLLSIQLATGDTWRRRSSQRQRGWLEEEESNVSVQHCYTDQISIASFFYYKSLTLRFQLNFLSFSCKRNNALWQNVLRLYFVCSHLYDFTHRSDFDCFLLYIISYRNKGQLWGKTQNYEAMERKVDVLQNISVKPCSTRWAKCPGVDSV